MCKGQDNKIKVWKKQINIASLVKYSINRSFEKQNDFLQDFVGNFCDLLNRRKSYCDRLSTCTRAPSLRQRHGYILTQTMYSLNLWWRAGSGILVGLCWMFQMKLEWDFFKFRSKLVVGNHKKTLAAPFQNLALLIAGKSAFFAEWRHVTDIQKSSS